MLCGEGAHVMMIARDPQRLQRAAAHVQAQGPGRVTTLGLDVVAPGAAERDGGLAEQLAAAGGYPREHVLATLTSRVPLGRFATAEEIANVIVFLCSQRASDVSGAAWSVDGGAVPVII
jgi:NAD(P)-dependent dehydrogenase (short-subunit alcohol dehydrogenase family)